MEKERFYWSEVFNGNWSLLEKALQNPETIFVYDIDGVLANTPKVVLNKFYQKSGIKVEPTEFNGDKYLMRRAQAANLDADIIEHAEDDWYKEETLFAAQRYLYVKPAVLKTIGFYGADRNFILTARRVEIKEMTYQWFDRELPQIKRENILTRDGKAQERGIEFKIRMLKELAAKAPWVIFIDDFDVFCQAIIDAGIENCLVINTPWNKQVLPVSGHEKLFILGRYPSRIRGMYPLLFALEKALVAHS
jgi:uncharacterized HAD superfamily protein